MDGPQFDVFLSYNSADRPTVERVAELLRQARLEPWLDRWNLTPGKPWQEEIVAGLGAAKTCAVFVGPAGLGDWAREELAVAQNRAAKERDFRIFMVLLPDAPEVSDPSLAFLRTRMWVDLRQGLAGPDGIDDLVAAVTGTPRRRDVVTAPGTCPYRGLEPFDEDHAQFFFGRDNDVALALEKLKAGRFVAVLGPSGSGKSSLLRAGLIPAVRRGALAGSEKWAVRVFTPGARPLVALAALLSRLFPTQAMQQTLDQLQQDQRSLDLAVSLALAERPPEERVVLVADQFEELFTLCRNEDERASFLANLLYAATIPGGRVVVVLGMRADFYHRCAPYPDLRAMLGEPLLVGPLDAAGLRQAIEEPAARVGLEIEKGLTDTILDSVSGRAGALPLLEHVLTQIWERRRGTMLTLEAYVATGGVEGALEQQADAIYGGFTPRQQEIARRVLLRLVQPGENAEDTRRRAGMDEIVVRPDDEGDVEAVVKALADQRLLTVATRPRGHAGGGDHPRGAHPGLADPAELAQRGPGVAPGPPPAGRGRRRMGPRRPDRRRAAPPRRPAGGLAGEARPHRPHRGGISLPRRQHRVHAGGGRRAGRGAAGPRAPARRTPAGPGRGGPLRARPRARAGAPPGPRGRGRGTRLVHRPTGAVPGRRRRQDRSDPARPRGPGLLRRLAPSGAGDRQRQLRRDRPPLGPGLRRRPRRPALGRG